MKKETIILLLQYEQGPPKYQSWNFDHLPHQGNRLVIEKQVFEIQNLVFNEKEKTITIPAKFLY